METKRLVAKKRKAHSVALTNLPIGVRHLHIFAVIPITGINYGPGISPIIRSKDARENGPESMY